jgi:hypothetical protein
LPFPKPRPGQVIRYSYLWNAEHLRGQEEGVKDRPCAIVLIVRDESGADVVTVLPITHTPPAALEARLAIEVPAATKRRLGLDDKPSWVVLSEANRFAWPGPDLRMDRTGGPESVVVGLLPDALFERIRKSFLLAWKARQAALVARTE